MKWTLTALFTFVVLVGVDYVSFTLRGLPVEYNWIRIGIVAAAIGLIEVFQPDGI